MANARLSEGGQWLSLPPKAFALLCVLVGQPGQLLSKTTLLDAVWPRQDVNESVLKTTVNQLRTVLKDDPREPRYIETVPRRGYRFIGRPGACAASETTHSDAAARSADPPSGCAVPVARAPALQRIDAAWRRAAEGRPQMILVVGDAGIGKTTLIDHFARTRGAGVQLGRGLCVEQRGHGEPYLPWLEALSALCLQDEALPALMRAVAPVWLAQMPWHLPQEQRCALAREIAGTGPARMLRELGELLDRVAARGPLLLVLEDLQWSDQPSLQALDYLARRRGTARQLVLASMRPTEAGSTHPAAELRTELRLRGLAQDLPLTALSAADVGDYLALRFPGEAAPPGLAQALHDHTDGLPLYLATLFDAAEANTPSAEVSALAWLAWPPPQVPESLFQLIERQLRKLPAADVELLEAAAVLGVDFWTRPLATLLGRPLPAVRAQVDALAKNGHWLLSLTATRLQDGSFDGRSEFRHGLYRHVLYQRLGAVPRAELHQRAAQALEASAALGLPVAPAELALHHEGSHDLPAAVHQLLAAGRLSMARFAPVEAAQLATRALALLAEDPGLCASQDSELALALTTLQGHAFAQYQGVAAPDAIRALSRARALCDGLPSTPAHGWVYSGLGWVHFTRGEFDQALELADRLEALAALHRDDALFVCACNLRGPALAYQGRLREAVGWLRRGLALCDMLGEALDNAPFLIDPVVSMQGNVALPLAQLGEIDEAIRCIDLARERAVRIGAPMARMLAQWCAALTGAALEDVPMVAAAVRAFADEADIAQGAGPVRWYAGWLRCRVGGDQAAEAVNEIVEGHACHLRLGMEAGCTHVHGYAAEAALRACDGPTARRELDAGLERALQLGEMLGLPELHMLDARLRSAMDDAQGAQAALDLALAQSHAQDAAWQTLGALLLRCELSGPGAVDAIAWRATLARIRGGATLPRVRRAHALLNRLCAHTEAAIAV
ncbi:AAA family ATPase [Variovorax sp. M-6]|uniref:AAA family ATPase n=1 Tax=Variovorax sp. M-6 TaxID=3233041 RepID=UPI003F9A9FBF